MLTTFGYVIAYALIGLVLGFFYKKVVLKSSSSSLTYLLIGVISSIISGLAGLAFFSYSFAVSQNKGTGDYANTGQAGNDLVGFNDTGIWLSLFAAIFGTLLVLTVYKMMDRKPDTRRT